MVREFNKKEVNIYSPAMQDFIEEQGIEPIDYDSNKAIYEDTEELQAALESYYIQRVLFKNQWSL